MASVSCLARGVDHFRSLGKEGCDENDLVARRLNVCAARIDRIAILSMSTSRLPATLN